MWDGVGQHWNCEVQEFGPLIKKSVQPLLSQQLFDMMKVATRHKVQLLPLPTDTLIRRTLLASKNNSRKIVWTVITNGVSYVRASKIELGGQ